MPAAEQRFPIVGIGASAGGLEALEGLFKGLAADTGMAFIVVTHLARNRPSALPEIIGRYTPMRVSAAKDDVAIEPNHVYICPPDHILTVSQRQLALYRRESDMQRKPIDVFLSSLGEDCGPAAIGIILSGCGNDGALGIKAIKEREGFTIAQVSDGTAPAHSDMPDAAIAAGVVDLLLPVEQMGARLAEYARSHAEYGELFERTRTEGDNRPVDDALTEDFPAIYHILLKQVGHDFSGYKEKTFKRRVHRRMQVLQIDRVETYVERLHESPDEVRLLFRDLLIGVTNFFRDTDAFSALGELVIPRLLAGKGANDIVRVWVPGCATGEECYSIAILLREHMDAMSAPPRVQIFATDIDEAALSIARSGRYPAPLLDSVSPSRLKRFFVRDDVTYSVTKEIREICVFSSHSVLRDPPFSRLDLISCRNLLIYLGPDFQAQVIPVFHFALRPRGFLFLGTSENVSKHADLFSSIDKKQRIFQRRDHVSAPMVLPMLQGARSPSIAAELRHEPANATVNLRRSVEARVMDHFAPPHVVINREGDILHYSPRTGKYLEPAAGLPNRQLLAMARRGLRIDLQSALREAVEFRRRATREKIPVEMDDRVQLIDLTIDPFGDDDSDPLFLVIFRDVGLPFLHGTTPRDASQSTDADLDRLEHELRDTRERLQSTIEEYETAVEELKSSNEELQSINEELQSTNEELETSKEELQSVNEELHTVNLELNNKVDDLDHANSDLRNLFESTKVATVFLDQKLVIRSFTPAVTSIFNLISSDRGRPLTDIVSQIDEGNLHHDIRTVLSSGEVIERNVRRTDGKQSYLMRILPYNDHKNALDGVVVTFIDVTRILDAEAHQRLLVEELNHRVRNMLTVVGAIANQSLAKSISPKDFVSDFSGRIQAMSSAYSLVSREGWNDVDLETIIRTQMSPFKRRPESGLKIGGPEIVLKPNAALAVGMVIHEFATNAAKYGALSKSKGSLSILWDVEGDGPAQLILRWIERDGPQTSPPSRKGFGTLLIEQELKHTLRATTEFSYERAGFEAKIIVPLDPAVLAICPQTAASS